MTTPAIRRQFAGAKPAVPVQLIFWSLAVAENIEQAEYGRHLPGVWVESVPAYTSYARAATETGIHVTTPEDAAVPAAIFGWPLIVPDDSDDSDERTRVQIE